MRLEIELDEDGDWMRFMSVWDLRLDEIRRDQRLEEIRQDQERLEIGLDEIIHVEMSIVQFWCNFEIIQYNFQVT